VLNLVVALNCEAKPLIEAFRLRRLSEKCPFPVYLGEETRLVISGMGKLNAAAATAWLHAGHVEAQDQAWLNLGTAGHGGHRIGTGILAHKIRDEAGGQSWYPPMAFPTRAATDEIITVDQAQMGYSTTACFEMEASGFYAAASRFASMELVQCYKVITDNPMNPYPEVTPALATELVQGRLSEILDICERLRGLAHDWTTISAPPPDYERLISRRHFTVNQRHQLLQLLISWRHHGPLPQGLDQMKHARAIINRLREGLQSI